MEYNRKFQHDFMNRTLYIMHEYKGPYDATILINCLLGLLVLPKETLINRIPPDPYEELAQWGINPKSIVKFGKCEDGYEHAPTLRQFVRRLRNAVAHFNVEPLNREEEVYGFAFRDRNGFHAEISLNELREFVINLAVYLEQETSN
jgi:hypothetical protein